MNPCDRIAAVIFHSDFCSMSSLQDQLLKAGLANTKQAKLASKAKKKQSRDQRKGKVPEDDVANRVAQEKQAQAERSKALNAQRQAQQGAKALLSQAKQIIQRCQVPMDDGDIVYNFVDAGKVKRLYVSAEQQALLSCGSLVIVGVDGHYSLVPSAVGNRIEARTDQVLIVRSQKEAEHMAADDPYADYVIPDDLMW